jgi:hypothetical protein
MARPLVISSVIVASIATWASFAVVPAWAQFNPFEAIFGSPPRPPSAVPGSRQQPPQGYPQYPERQYPPRQYPADQQYPDRQYPEHQYPGHAGIPRQGPGGGVQSQPLPPPAGGSAAIDQRGPPAPGMPGQRPRGTPLPANTAPQPGDEVIAEPPSQKIANKSALFSGLDKITGRIINFDVAIGETVQFGALQVTPRICYTRPPTETPNTDAFVEVDEVTLQGEVKRIFTGWVFAASPGLHAVEHPIYDVWLTDCKSPVVAAAAPIEPPAEAQPPPRPSAPASQRRPAQQPQQGAAQSTIPRR